MAADLFGLERTPPRCVDRKEAAALVEVLKALRSHAAVAWCELDAIRSAHAPARESDVYGRDSLDG